MDIHYETRCIMTAYCQVNTLLKVASKTKRNNTGKVTILFTLHEQVNIQNNTIRCQVICEKDRKYTYKLSVKALRLNIFAVREQDVLHILRECP